MMIGGYELQQKFDELKSRAKKVESHRVAELFTAFGLGSLSFLVLITMGQRLSRGYEEKRRSLHQERRLRSNAEQEAARLREQLSVLVKEAGAGSVLLAAGQLAMGPCLTQEALKASEKQEARYPKNSLAAEVRLNVSLVDWSMLSSSMVLLRLQLDGPRERKFNIDSKKPNRYDVNLDHAPPAGPGREFALALRRDVEAALGVEFFEAVLGKGYRANAQGLVISKCGAPAQAWHVDSSHLFVGIKDLPCHFVTVFCPLYGMEEAIGPTEFILGSQHFTHWLPTLEVSDQYPPEETVELIRSEAKTWASDLGEGEIQMDCEAGDIVVMDGRLLHRAQANRLPESEKVQAGKITQAIDFRSLKHSASLQLAEYAGSEARQGFHSNQRTETPPVEGRVLGRMDFLRILSKLQEDIFAALGEELEHEDCSLSGGRDCKGGIAFLQTKSAYTWTSLEAETATAAVPSFFQMEEVTSQVGVVHGASSATTAMVGEVHMDRSRQMRQWQEDAIEIYAETHAQSANSAAAAVTVATISESRGALAKMQFFLTASGLWLAVVLILLVFLAAAWFGRWWAAPAKAETAEATDAADVADDAEKVEDSYNFDPKQSGRVPEKSSGAQSNELQRYIQIIQDGGGPPPLGLLRAPLSQRSCVFVSAAAEEVGNVDGLPLQKKAIDSVDFQVSLVGAPSIRIDVTGSDLTMLDALEDNWTPPQPLNSLPRPWREFLEVSHLATGSFRFREDVLLVGSQVLLCGELLRDSRGRIFLQPWEAPAVGCESWRTSWECASSKLQPTVLASNDMTLAEGPKIDCSETCFLSGFETAEFPQPFLML
ncbi:Uncharacterized protein SCF082_LOCUS14043 [Durusdinium trenchii]|uniref:Uncharacterized protein n=1 Tax=Durusdinium trenchii TaxID=1381693 RepID=A0ABP0JV29_9DINO